MGEGTEPSASGLTNLPRLLGTALYMSGEATSRVAAHLDDVARQIGEIFEAPSRRSPVTTIAGHLILVTGLGMITNPEPKALLCYAALGLLVGVLKLVASVFSILTEALPAVAAPARRELAVDIL